MSLITDLTNLYNNPGALTVTGSNNYPGQTGVYSPGNGLNYAIFDTPQSGVSAIQTWLNNNVGTNPATSYTTLGEVASVYTGGNQNAVNNYGAATGLGANSTITPDTPGLLAGILTNEGGIGGGLSGVTNYLQNLFNGSNPAMAAGFAAATAGSPGASSSNPIQSLNTFLQEISSGNFVVDLVFVIAGFILLAGAVYMFGVSQGVAPPPAEIARGAALAVAA